MNNYIPTANEVRQLLRYEPDTGMFFWKERALASFANERAGKIWNAKYANKKAGSVLTEGYVQIKLMGKKYLAHRLAWLCVNGDWPTQEIDHMNRIRNDNRIVNLRDVSKSENLRNTTQKGKTAVKLSLVYVKPGYVTEEQAAQIAEWRASADQRIAKCEISTV